MISVQLYFIGLVIAVWAWVMLALWLDPVPRHSSHLPAKPAIRKQRAKRKARVAAKSNPTTSKDSI